MMRALRLALWAGFCTTGLALLGTGAMLGSYRVDTVQSVRYARSLSRLVELDAMLNEQVAEAQLGFVAHYDDLVRTHDAWTHHRTLIHTLPIHFSGEAALGLQETLQRLDASMEQKESDLERFKTELAVLRNARRALPASLHRLEEALADRPAERAAVAADAQALLLHLLDPQADVAPDVACGLARLAPKVGPLPDGCAGPLLAAAPAAATGVRRMGEVLLHRKPKVQALIRSLLTNPVATEALAAAAIHDRATAEAVATSTALTDVVELMGALCLLFGLGIVLVRIKSDASALRDHSEALATANTALVRERDREAELARLKNRFVAMTSHEFRTPLAVILSSVELLSAYGHRWGPERQKKHFDRIEANGRAMSRMIDRVLLIGRADAEMLTLRPDEVFLPDVVSDVIAEVCTGAETDRIVQVDGTLPDYGLWMDPNLLRHILTNLLSNAMKYSPADTPIRLAIEPAEAAVDFRVEDHGIGIPDEDLPTLFEPFHRCTNVGSVAGTGLGLAIVKRAVDIHGGTLTVDSVVGKGTTFRVHLPLLSDAA